MDVFGKLMWCNIIGAMLFTVFPLKQLFLQHVWVFFLQHIEFFMQCAQLLSQQRIHSQVFMQHCTNRLATCSCKGNAVILTKQFPCNFSWIVSSSDIQFPCSTLGWVLYWMYFSCNALILINYRHSFTEFLNSLVKSLYYSIHTRTKSSVRNSSSITEKNTGLV